MNGGINVQLVVLVLDGELLVGWMIVEVGLGLSLSLRFLNGSLRFLY